jgi:hypothetical protein
LAHREQYFVFWETGLLLPPSLLIEDISHL